jgi:chemotaxis regulatin CheY-phosphate phosphatase CheZ
VRSHWSVIDGFVRDIGSFAVDVHMAERTLATDPRTRAARTALDAATDAVCTAIDQVTADAEARAGTAVERARATIAQLGLTIQDSRSLVHASQDLIKRAGRNAARAVELRRAAPRPRRRRR